MSHFFLPLIFLIFINQGTFALCHHARKYYDTIDGLHYKLVKNKTKPKVSKDKAYLLELLRHAYPNDLPEISIELNLKEESFEDTTIDSILSSSIEDFAVKIAEILASNSDWGFLKDKRKDKRFSKNWESFKTAVSSNKYLLAWFYFVEKEFSKSAKTLEDLFVEEHKKVMSINFRIEGSNCGDLPRFFWLRTYYNNLKVLKDEVDFDKIKEMYKEFELHLSNVPSVHILT